MLRIFNIFFTRSNGLLVGTSAFTDKAKCLINIPNKLKAAPVVKKGENLLPADLSDFSARFPGQCFTLVQQCQTIYGNMSTYCGGVS